MNYSQFKARERMRNRRPPNMFSVQKANAKGAEMLGNMYDYVKSGGASLQRALRDKGRLPVGNEASVDERFRDIIRNNTGQNLQISPELAERQGFRAGVQRNFIKAMTGDKATKVREFLSMPPPQGLDDTKAIAGTASRYLIPITGAGIALQTIFGGRADQQEDAQLQIPGNGQKQGGISAAEAGAIAALIAGGGVGVGYAGNNAFNNTMFDDGIDATMPRRPRIY